MDDEKWWRISLQRSLLVCFTTCLILGCSGLFFTFPCAFLAVNVSLLFPIAAGILFVSCFTSFIITSFMDPGILQGSVISVRQSFDPKVVTVSGKVYYLKWCQVCQFYRPPRCSHCRLCDVCIEDFDHHCKWVNNCVGRRNYRFFFFFVFFLAVYMLTILGSCIMYLIINYNEPMTMEKSVTYIVLAPIAMFLFPVLFLFGAHTEYMVLGVTMSEQYNKTEDRTNPFSRGWKRNIFIMLCDHIVPRYLGSLKKLDSRKTSWKRNSKQVTRKKGKKEKTSAKIIKGTKTESWPH
ncbi:palmitoyltransferase ZDHHC5-A-like [Leucoraja erinacea]|uniref:palmitoyltransferase ZDHHC5-A-like n=1 Tax=Leucoraja erinaceus TaxID=7782 RepID=UPI00245814DB|nr:palmitoyltransferase ZDHHC5-A-like [Leucoraja erinacea]